MNWESGLRKSRFMSLYTLAAAILYACVMGVGLQYHSGTLDTRRMILLIAANLAFVGFLLLAAYKRWPRAHR